MCKNWSTEGSDELQQQYTVTTLHSWDTVQLLARMELLHWLYHKHPLSGVQHYKQLPKPETSSNHS